MFKYIYSFFGYKDEPSNQNTQLLNNKSPDYTQLENPIKKYNCTYCFNSFNTVDEQDKHQSNCKQKPKPKNDIICDRCGRENHTENNCFEIKHIHGYYLRKFK
jgi:hypothetical protein